MLLETVPNQELVKYLVTFRDDICKCLEQSKFFEKSLDGIIDEEKVTPNRKKGKEK